MNSLARRARPRRPWKRGRLTVLALNRPEPGPPAGSFTADPEITETAIRIRRLPPAYDGLKIVHLTDIHLSLLTSIDEVGRAIELANQEQPDIVCLTGDYVTLSPRYIWPAARAMGRLRARYGVFAVLGNHDFRVSPEEVTRALEAQRIRVLRNARYPLRTPGGTLWFAGVDDVWGAFDDFDAAVGSIPARDPKILLCHNPLAAPLAARHGIDLMLSGHTHGGQVRFPFLRSVRRPNPRRRLLDGWHQLGNTQIYISRGIGKVVVPLRVSCPPEISCLHLRRH
jgi:uncharacterized protein